MDPLRQEGAISLLGSAIAEIAESLDDDVWRDEWWTSSYDDGVPVVMAIAGRTEKDATEYAVGVVRAALEHIEHLRGWEIISCVICQEDGTTGLPRPRDHLVAW